jgi:hypothetical protein
MHGWICLPCTHSAHLSAWESGGGGGVWPPTPANYDAVHSLFRFYKIFPTHIQMEGAAGAVRLPLRFPPIPRLSNCLAAGPRGMVSILCDGGAVAVLDTAAATGAGRFPSFTSSLGRFGCPSIGCPLPYPRTCTCTLQMVVDGGDCFGVLSLSLSRTKRIQRCI